MLLLHLCTAGGGSLPRLPPASVESKGAGAGPFPFKQVKHTFHCAATPTLTGHGAGQGRGSRGEGRWQGDGLPPREDGGAGLGH